MKRTDQPEPPATKPLPHIAMLRAQILAKLVRAQRVGTFNAEEVEEICRAFRADELRRSGCVNGSSAETPPTQEAAS